jgi:glutamate-1-semialdehyde 2,1-aminomutase
VEAVCSAARNGLSFGAPCEDEVRLAEMVTDAVPWLEMVRFVSSGTEAVMSAIRLARGVTGRDAVVKFTGCYHGHVDHLLVSAGSGLATFGTPVVRRRPRELRRPHPGAGAGRRGSLPERLMAERGDEVAAVIIEGIPANSGLLIQRPEFLAALREECTRHGALLIFDEVITGFRVGPGGASVLHGIEPDLATYGKIIGGGMPVGAYGGRRDLMEHLAPLGPVYQAGTLSGNPTAMAAGARRPSSCCWPTTARPIDRLEMLGDRMATGLRDIFSHPGSAVVGGPGRVHSVAVAAGGRRSRAASRTSRPTPAPRMHRSTPRLLERGVYLAPSAYEVTFVSLAHDETVIDETLEAFDAAAAPV